jgi:Zn-dependent membrane protease YugP
MQSRQDAMGCWRGFLIHIMFERWIGYFCFLFKNFGRYCQVFSQWMACGREIVKNILEKFCLYHVQSSEWYVSR